MNTALARERQAEGALKAVAGRSGLHPASFLSRAVRREPQHISALGFFPEEAEEEISGSLGPAAGWRQPLEQECLQQEAGGSPGDLVEE